MLKAVGEGAAVPGFEGGQVGGDVAAFGEPGAKQPIERALLEFDVAAQRDFRHAHGREIKAADVALGLEIVGDFDGNVVTASF